MLYPMALPMPPISDDKDYVSTKLACTLSFFSRQTPWLLQHCRAVGHIPLISTSRLRSGTPFSSSQDVGVLIKTRSSSV
jgi:hypothetical protein